jgi:hypothetical protein
MFSEADRAIARTMERQVQEIAWLLRNSSGVTGLTPSGDPMPWDQVVSLYMPSWAAMLRMVRR